MDRPHSKLKVAITRRRYIIDRIKAGDAVRVTAVAAEFGCSPHTIRNDLKYLRTLGVDVHSKRGIIGASDHRRSTIVREIRFPPLYKDAGVSILAYFARVIEEKYPNSDAIVSILQDGDRVTLKVESDEGEVESIERTLADYGEVVKGNLSADRLLPNQLAVIDLNNKLEMAKMELRMKEQSHQLLASQQSERIASLESQVAELRGIVGNHLGIVNNLVQAINTVTTSVRVPDAVTKSLETVSRLLEADHTAVNEQRLREVLEDVREKDAPLFARLKEAVGAFSNSIAANVATPWVVTVLNSIPR